MPAPSRGGAPPEFPTTRIAVEQRAERRDLHGDRRWHAGQRTSEQRRRQFEQQQAAHHQGVGRFPPLPPSGDDLARGDRRAVPDDVAFGQG
jgi:hypothetical protein